LTKIYENLSNTIREQALSVWTIKCYIYMDNNGKW